MNILAFNILTIPDTQSGREIYGLGNDNALDDKGAAKAMFHLRQQQTGCDVLPLYLQKIIAISVVQHVIDSNSTEIVEHPAVKSLGDEKSSEQELISTFFELIEQSDPYLISWNGTELDLQVIQYRAFKYGLSSKLTQLTNINLSSELASFNAKEKASLNHMMILLGYAAQKPVNHLTLWKKYLSGKLSWLREYNEITSLHVYLAYLHCLLLQGKIEPIRFRHELNTLRYGLEQSSDQHLLHVKI